jgi:hypothetical protein
VKQANLQLAKRTKEIVYSSEGLAAAIEATKSGFPALQGVDPILKERLGADYRSDNGATLEAGFWIDKMLLAQGYRSLGKNGKLSSSCVATTGKIFVPSRQFTSVKK